MRKLLVVLSIVLIFILSLGLISCAPKDSEGLLDAEKEIEIDETKQYEMNYQEGQASCRMVLDGQGHCSIYKKYDLEKPINEENQMSFQFLVSGKFLHITNYVEGELDFSNNYCFLEDGTMVIAGEGDRTKYIPYQDIIASGKTYSITYNAKVDRMDAEVTLSIKPIKYESGLMYVAAGYKVSVPEFLKATGEYGISNKKYIKLKFNYTDDFPVAGLKSYENLTLGENYATRLIEEETGRKNGHVEITIRGANKRYVQLKDDGTFYFVISSTTSNPADLYTQDTYYGKSFTTKIETVENGEGYTYEYKLTFDDQGNAKYECTSATMVKYYVATNAEGELAQVYYDVDEYNKLIGTHMQLGTSNNISFANNYVVYVDYNYSRYEIEGDTNITLCKFDDFVYGKFKDTNGAIIVVKFLNNGEFEWIVSDFSGVDLSDHSEDF